MGLLWWRSNGNPQPKSPADPKPDPKSQPQAPGMNGAVEVPRPPPSASDVTVFEFGSVANTTDKVTVAGYCPVSDELEPCRWDILPADDSNAPQFPLQWEAPFGKNRVRELDMDLVFAKLRAPTCAPDHRLRGVCLNQAGLPTFVSWAGEIPGKLSSKT